MAPEIFRGEKYGFSVDTYSLGLVMYRLLNKNRLPFLPPAPQEFMLWDQEAAFARRIAGEPIPPPYYSQGRLPEIVLKACAPNAKDRYSSPVQMRQELEAILYEQSDSAYIYPDGDTLENLKEYYASQRSVAGGSVNEESKSESISGKTANLFAGGTSTELIDPEEGNPLGEETNYHTEPRWRKLSLGVLAAICVCAVPAVGIFTTLHGRNTPAPGETSAIPPSQTLTVEPSPSVSPLPSPTPSQVTPETDFNIEDGVLVKYLGSGGDVVIPDGVTSIGELVFSDCEGLTSISIPDSVTSIGRGAFWGCTGLISVTIPDSVTSIGPYAFSGCNGLTSITIPDGVTSIEEHAFYYCTSLTSVTIPDSVTSIGSYAFSGCKGLTSITIPDSVTSIEENAFIYCTSLTSISISDSVTSIGNSVFCGCDNLTSVTIPDSVTSIGTYAFAFCDSLTSVAIPDSVAFIGYGAFRSCQGLTEVAIPNSVTNIGVYAFTYCTSLTSVTIPNGVTWINSSAFSDCTGLTSVTIPDCVTSIEMEAFAGCTNLKEVYYTGTQAQWGTITIKEGNDPILNSTIHCIGG